MLLLELLPPARAVVAFATLPADGPAVVVCGPPPPVDSVERYFQWERDGEKGLMHGIP